MNDKDKTGEINAEILMMLERRVLETERELTTKLGEMSKNIVNQIEQTNHILKTGIFTLARVPISLGGIGLVTFLYWHNRIDQYPWMILCVLFLSPFYSEGMKMIGEFMQRRNGKS